MYRFLLNLYLYIFVFIIRADDDAPVVTTVKGIIRGMRSEDGNYNMFLGIPYAKVDEANPFGTSIPYPPFVNVFEANDGSSICPQIEEYNNSLVGNIDCLRLNIYTPLNVNTTSRLPVYVYIYGGYFSFGLNSRNIYGPKYLVRHDIILVMMNYRVGSYGFMCLDIPEVPGNQGLKDQIMAFRWVQSNIKAFGGDPDKVTIGGNSAGADAVDYHIHRDNIQEKLYNQAILQSGHRFRPTQRIIKDAPIVLARYFKFITVDIYQAIAFLATLPPTDIILAEYVLKLKINVPCLEKKFPGVESYATVAWFEQKPGAANISFLIGNNDDELGVKASNTSYRNEMTNISNIIDIYFDTQHEEFQAMSELVERFYFVENNFGLDFFNMLTDLRFLYPSYNNMREFINNDAAAVYVYNFTYVGKKNYMHRISNLNKPFALHADELGYLFEVGFMPEEPTVADQLFIDKMTTLWTNFVKYGDPTPELTELIDVKWKPVTTTSNIYCMNINSKLTLTSSSFVHRARFWDLFFKQYSHLLKKRP